MIDYLRLALIIMQWDPHMYENDHVHVGKSCGCVFNDKVCDKCEDY